MFGSELLHLVSNTMPWNALERLGMPWNALDILQNTSEYMGQILYPR